MTHIIHFMPNTGGGTPKHIQDLTYLFPNYKHILVKDVNSLVQLFNNMQSDWKRVHLHSAVNHNYTDVQWGIVSVLGEINKLKPSIELWMTVHDYQWIMPSRPNPLREEFHQHIPHPERTQMVEKLFDIQHRIIFPSNNIYQNYSLIVKLPKDKCIIVPHCDVEVSFNEPVIPAINENQPIRIAFVGYYFFVKGHFLFDKLVEYFKEYRDHPIEYHIFGEIHQKSSQLDLGKIKIHGKYDDDHLGLQLMDHGIHIICHFSVAEESYCYALTRTMQTGLPIFYLKRGAIQERLKHEKNMFYDGFENGYEMIPRLKQMIDKLILNVNNKQNKWNHILKKNNWYANHY